MTSETATSGTGKTRDLLRAVGALAVVEGVAFVIGAGRAAGLLRKAAPAWSAPWLRRIETAPGIFSRLYGIAEIVLGLRVLALTPPTPRIVEEISDLALQPVRAFWRLSLAADAERAYGQVLNEMVWPGARILDLGCGEGDNLARILEEGLAFGSYVGVDTSPEVLAQGRARFAGLPKVDFFSNDLNSDQLPTGEFDVILCTWALDRIADPNDLIVRAMRQLRHGGHAILLFASPVSDNRRTIVETIARLGGRALRPASLFNGLPSFTTAESFSGGLISLVSLENSEKAHSLVNHPIDTSGPG